MGWCGISTKFIKHQFRLFLKKPTSFNKRPLKFGKNNFKELIRTVFEKTAKKTKIARVTGTSYWLICTTYPIITTYLVPS